MLLPDTDPNIGEMILQTLYANPDAGMVDCMLGLLAQAPDHVHAREIAEGFFQLAVCKEKGQLYWLREPGQTILTGITQATSGQGIMFGTARWPMKALIQGPPIKHVVRMPKGAREVFMVGDLRECVVRMSEAVAIGQITVEALGGRLIEDREGPEVAHKSFLEHKVTERARLRAQANRFEDRMEVKQKEDDGYRDGEHPRAAMILAWPTFDLELGVEVVNEEVPDQVYVIESRLNRDYAIIVAKDKGQKVVPPGPWVRRDGRPPIATEGVPPHVGFTNEPTRVAGVADGLRPADERTAEPGDEEGAAAVEHPGGVDRSPEGEPR